MQPAFFVKRLYAIVQTAFFWLSKAMAIVASAALSLMMLFTVVDVIGRYFFNAPLKGAWELIGICLVCAGTWALAYCQKENGHIHVTVLLHRFSPSVKAGILAVSYFLGFIAFSFISWRAVLLAQKFYFEKGHYTDILKIPYTPFILIMAAGTGMLALVLLVNLIQSIVGIDRK